MFVVLRYEYLLGCECLDDPDATEDLFQEGIRMTVFLDNARIDLLSWYGHQCEYC